MAIIQSKNHYVYLTTNIISGKQYVGDHTIGANGHKYYLGSGSYFCNAVKVYGENNFFKEILEWCDTREEASKLQEKYIKQFNTLKPNGYNISPTGGVGVQGCHSEETKKQIKNSCIGKTSPHAYTLIDPKGIKYENVSLIHMCREHNLNFDTLRKHINYGKIKTKKTYHINKSTLNCENWEVIRIDKPKHEKIVWQIISPDNEIFLIKSKELTIFIDEHLLDWRTLHKWKNNGKIKIRNLSLSSDKTLHTIGWEIKKYD